MERLSLWGFCEGNLEGGSHAVDPEGHVEKVLQMGISFHRGFVGEPGRGHAYLGFDRWMKGALGMEHLSMKSLSGESLDGGLLYWGPWKIR